MVPSAAELWAEADIVAKVRAPTPEEVELARAGQIVISFVYPAQNPELLESLKAKGVTAHRHGHGAAHQPRARRWTRSRSMANIAGYRAVIEAGENFGRFFTGQITAAGKVPPAKVLVIGAGVAGLSAIGTARGLGAIVRSFDVRPEVAEQIEIDGRRVPDARLPREPGRRRHRRLRRAVVARSSARSSSSSSARRRPRSTSSSPPR